MKQKPSAIAIKAAGELVCYFYKCGRVSGTFNVQEIAAVLDGSAMHAEIMEWRETVCDLIQALPEPKRMLLCAHMATVPNVAKKLNNAQKAQARLILKIAGES
jgi:hypothetical protein